jgi:hypothetical protein
LVQRTETLDSNVKSVISSPQEVYTMASEAQIAANRANAALSTGPKSMEGKEKSSMNALRHGLRSRVAAALGEDNDDFNDYHLQLVLALLPRDAYELMIVRRLAQLGWRLERVSGMEAAMLDGVASRIDAIQARYAASDDPPTFEAGRPADDLWNPEMPLVARYEAALDRAFNRNMAALDRYRAPRRPARKNAAANHDFLPNEANSGAAEAAENPIPAREWEPPTNPNDAFYRRNEANSAARAESKASG